MRSCPTAPGYCPKATTGVAESIRVLHLTRAGAIKARTAAVNELRALLITAPAGLREHLTDTPAQALINACGRLRPGTDLTDPLHATKHALRVLAHRHQALTHQPDRLTTPAAF